MPPATRATRTQPLHRKARVALGTASTVTPTSPKTASPMLMAAFVFAAASAQQPVKATYVIDGKKVENFDGSQPRGKTIVNYTIEPEHNIHVIITSAYGTKGQEIAKVQVTSTQERVEAGEGKAATSTSEGIHVGSSEVTLFVLDGKTVPYASIKGLPSPKVASMKVIKDKQDSDYIKYSKDAKQAHKCIVVITTK